MRTQTYLTSTSAFCEANHTACFLESHNDVRAGQKFPRSFAEITSPSRIRLGSGDAPPGHSDGREPFCPVQATAGDVSVEAALGEARGFERRFFLIAEGSRYAVVQD